MNYTELVSAAVALIAGWAARHWTFPLPTPTPIPFPPSTPIPPSKDSLPDVLDLLEDIAGTVKAIRHTLNQIAIK